MAEGEPIYRDYQAVRRQLDSAIRAEEQALLKRIQQEYDAVAPMSAIQRQLNGEVSEDDDDPFRIEMAEIRLVERCQIAEVAMREPSTFSDHHGFSLHVQFAVDMIACKRRGRPRPRTQHPPENIPIRVVEDPTPSVKSEPEIKPDQPLHSSDVIPCPDTHMCSEIVLDGKMAFKAHSAKVHGFIL
ncbi:hypothetical protein BGW36DRAFT_398826 [Talaromyces proteolyticus]|uniref:C2H2-type domain-containing protein n=1 Tax=Talaromyces proteolyticus TaxID=1131652 RepID=A0AAD4PUY3_9EURO|nr:uncharacterized protein BGW36DRAFT_398826 [Talaromyces proteolyticus]KAH8695666.1 hypothetical protein BGW36DRAFT_398826 [Talaromyces proteolyticus]